MVFSDCRTIVELDRRIGLSRDATRAPIQARSGWWPSGRLLVSPLHHLRTGKILSNRWGPPHLSSSLTSLTFGGYGSTPRLLPASTLTTRGLPWASSLRTIGNPRTDIAFSGRRETNRIARPEKLCTSRIRTTLKEGVKGSQIRTRSVPAPTRKSKLMKST